MEQHNDLDCQILLITTPKEEEEERYSKTIQTAHKWNHETVSLYSLDQKLYKFKHLTALLKFFKIK